MKDWERTFTNSAFVLFLSFSFKVSETVWSTSNVPVTLPTGWIQDSSSFSNKIRRTRKSILFPVWPKISYPNCSENTVCTFWIKVQGSLVLEHKQTPSLRIQASQSRILLLWNAEDGVKASKFSVFCIPAEYRFTNRQKHQPFWKNLLKRELSTPETAAHYF